MYVRSRAKKYFAGSDGVCQQNAPFHSIPTNCSGIKGHRFSLATLRENLLPGVVHKQAAVNRDGGRLEVRLDDEGGEQRLAILR